MKLGCLHFTIAVILVYSLSQKVVFLFQSFLVLIVNKKLLKITNMFLISHCINFLMYNHKTSNVYPQLNVVFYILILSPVKGVITVISSDKKINSSLLSRKTRISSYLTIHYMAQVYCCESVF